MMTTEKETARILADALVAYGIQDLFVSPGSRNTPLLMALTAREELTLRAVVDERSAAFMALGYSLVGQRAVGLVCTSGTALLNYAPAVAEAYYRKVPLIVISADRPAAWIEQDDSQTLPQQGVFAGMARGTFSLRGEIASDTERWEANRLINEALQSATMLRPGPVHINISFCEPLTACEETSDASSFRKIDLMLPPANISVEEARRLAAELEGRKVLIVGGFCTPDSRLNSAIAKLASLPDIVVVADALANINAPGVADRPDLWLKALESIEAEGSSSIPAFTPDILITFGGSLLSKHLKEYLRAASFEQHWHVGCNNLLIDSYFSLTRRIEISEENFFRRFASAMEHCRRRHPASEAPKSMRMEAYCREVESHSELVLSRGWCEEFAISRLLDLMPAKWNLQLSNGLTPRYAMMGNASRFHRRDCNRGVSGIDGSTSTALGASLVYKGTTVLLTGDMSLQYDIAALTSDYLGPQLKVVVINNGGGGIFTKISATRSLEFTDRLLRMNLRNPLRELAATYGMKYLRADSPQSLEQAVGQMEGEETSAVLLEVVIPQ